MREASIPMSTATETIEETRTDEKPDDEDQLKHLFCGCWFPDGVPVEGTAPIPYCGKKKTRWVFQPIKTIQPQELCIVCHEVSKQPCIKCGAHRWPS